MELRLRLSADGPRDFVSFPLIASFMTAPLPQDGIRGEVFHPASNPFGAEPFEPRALLGKVVLLRRGKVTFDTKVRAVEAAGGCAALVIVDSGDGASINVNIRNSAGAEAGHEGPVVLGGISKLAGEDLRVRGAGQLATITSAGTAMGEAFTRCSGEGAGKHDGGRRIERSAAYVSQGADALGRTWLMAAAAMDNTGVLGGGMAALKARDGGSDDACGMDVLTLVCQADDEGDTALHHAARNGSTRCAKLLLEVLRLGGDGRWVGQVATTRNKEGYTPLGLAAEYGRTEFVALLLAGFGVDANDDKTAAAGEDHPKGHPKGGVSLPLHHAATKGFVGPVSELIRAGADTTLLNAKGETAATVAVGAAQELLANPLVAALRSLVDGRVDMQQAWPAIEKALKADLGEGVEVVEVTPNANEALGAGFLAAAQRMQRTPTPGTDGGGDGGGGDGCGATVDPMLRMLWHGCGPGVLGLLLKDGFKTSFSSLDFNVYGAGIYFAVDARLSTFFLTTNPKTGQPTPPDPVDGCYVLILAAVLLGRTGVRPPLLAGSESEKGSMGVALKHPANRNPPVGCHSATGQKLKEVVLYENSGAFPAFTVRFRLPAHAPPLPDPYDEDERTQHTYLRALPDAPRGIIPGWRDATGVPAELDKGGAAGLAQLVHDAALVMGWDPEAACAEQAAADALRGRAQSCEARVVALEAEVKGLRRTAAMASAVAVLAVAAAVFFARRRPNPIHIYNGS